MITASAILSLAEQFSVATGVPLVSLSSRIFNDSKKLNAIKAQNADLTLRRAKVALDWLSHHWPEDAAWPEEITRPNEPLNETGAAQ